MTIVEIKAILNCINECGHKVTPSLVFGMAHVIDPTVTIEDCKAAMVSPEVTIKDTLDAWQQQVRAKREAEAEEFSKLSQKEQETYIAAWEEQQYRNNI